MINFANRFQQVDHPRLTKNFHKSLSNFKLNELNGSTAGFHFAVRRLTAAVNRIYVFILHNYSHFSERIVPVKCGLTIFGTF